MERVCETECEIEEDETKAQETGDADEGRKTPTLIKQNLFPAFDWRASVVACTDQMLKRIRAEAAKLTIGFSGGADFGIAMMIAEIHPELRV